MRTQHVSSRAPNTRELIIDIFEKVSLSPYIFLYEFEAIVALVRTHNRHLSLSLISGNEITIKACQSTMLEEHV